MNNTIITLDLAKTRHADLVEQARRNGLAKFAVRGQGKSLGKSHTARRVSRSGQRSMT